ncbi:MAG: 1,4-dihydroxy-6-naphthoate synthase [Desulfovibrio sp.]
MNLSFGYSPCPNDTYIFYALAHGLIPCPHTFDISLADVEELNGSAARGELDICKVSVHAAAHILDEYMLLRAGGAMGYGVGPIIVSKSAQTMADLQGKRIAIPGKNTTANLLFTLHCKEAGIEWEPVEMVFDEVMPAVQSGQVDGGIVIHEGRFTYEQYGLRKLLDLGDWWDVFQGLPIPLGAIAVKRSLGMEVAKQVNDAIRQSLEYSNAHPESAAEYIRTHAQEMDEAVVKSHIQTFVTDYSLNVGDDGAKAVEFLLQEVVGEKLTEPVFLP